MNYFHEMKLFEKKAGRIFPAKDPIFTTFQKIQQGDPLSEKGHVGVIVKATQDRKPHEEKEVLMPHWRKGAGLFSCKSELISAKSHCMFRAIAYLFGGLRASDMHPSEMDLTSHLEREEKNEHISSAVDAKKGGIFHPQVYLLRAQ